MSMSSRNRRKIFKGVAAALAAAAVALGAGALGDDDDDGEDGRPGVTLEEDDD